MDLSERPVECGGRSVNDRPGRSAIGRALEHERGVGAVCELLAPSERRTGEPNDLRATGASSVTTGLLRPRSAAVHSMFEDGASAAFVAYEQPSSIRRNESGARPDVVTRHGLQLQRRRHVAPVREVTREIDRAAAGHVVVGRDDLDAVTHVEDGRWINGNRRRRCSERWP